MITITTTVLYHWTETCLTCDGTGRVKAEPNDSDTDGTKKCWVCQGRRTIRRTAPSYFFAY